MPVTLLGAWREPGGDLTTKNNQSRYQVLPQSLWQKLIVSATALKSHQFMEKDIRERHVAQESRDWTRFLKCFQ